MLGRIFTGVIVDQRVADQWLVGVSDTDQSNMWVAEAYRDFVQVVSGEGFPCLFGRSGLKRGSLKLLFVSSDHHETELVAGLASYTDFVRATPVDDRLYSPLIVIFEPKGFADLASEHAFCWNQLETLHRSDPSAWPIGVPTDPQDSRWSFCFDGLQLFFNMSCPHHFQLKSRNLGQRITFVVNPRENFDRIASVKSMKGVKVRETIRGRVRIYNGGLVPPELGFFGDDKNLEWKQYLLNEPDTTPPETCPWHFAGKIDSHKD